MKISGLVRLVIDDGGQELVEYALVSGVIWVGSVLLFLVLAGVMHAQYSGWQSGQQGIWEPCAPAPAACP